MVDEAELEKETWGILYLNAWDKMLILYYSFCLYFSYLKND